MTLNPLRGAKFGASSALLVPIVMSINHYIKGEKIILGSLVIGTIFAFFFFAAIGTLTDKIGSEVSD